MKTTVEEEKTMELKWISKGIRETGENSWRQISAANEIKRRDLEIRGTEEQAILELSFGFPDSMAKD